MHKKRLATLARWPYNSLSSQIQFLWSDPMGIIQQFGWEGGRQKWGAKRKNWQLAGAEQPKFYDRRDPRKSSDPGQVRYFPTADL
jgi:hypothetical protein